MDKLAAVARVYRHLENGHVDKAVMTCLRIARNVRDYMSTATFLREMYAQKEDFARALLDDTAHLNEEAQKYLFDRSLEDWIKRHTLDPRPDLRSGDEEGRILALGVGEFDTELEQAELMIQDMKVPAGMSSHDTAVFTDRYTNLKVQLRMKIREVAAIKNRVNTLCLNFAIRVERQMQAQDKSQSFLQQIQSDVNNYFSAHSEDVYTKLQKAAQLVDSSEAEDRSLLLTQVRRAIKAAADFFYPARSEPMTCSDGKERRLGNDEYLNRLQEFLATNFQKSSSRELLRAELDHLAMFARRLNDVASKGVHAEVSATEAKQGLLGLYMFLHNVIARLQEGPAS